MITTELINKTFDYFDNFKNESFVVNPSLPILYFGDLASYKRSDIKILTVGKNPSDNEFRLKKSDKFSFVRFSSWNETTRNLIPTLNNYFEDKPLKLWFSCFEPILNGLRASYYKGKKTNIALHTDVCSPLATDPTWSKLSKDNQNSLYKEGLFIWKELIEELQPDIMLVSIPSPLFKSIFQSTSKVIITFNEKKNGELRKKPYIVELYEYQLKNGKIVKVVYGQAANKPFDTIYDEQKFQIGKVLCQK